MVLIAVVTILPYDHRLDRAQRAPISARTERAAPIDAELVNDIGDEARGVRQVMQARLVDQNFGQR